MALSESPRSIFLPSGLQSLLLCNTLGLAQDYQNEFAKLWLLIETIFNSKIQPEKKEEAKSHLLEAIKNMKTYKDWIADKVAEYNRQFCGGKLDQRQERGLCIDCLSLSDFSDELHSLSQRYKTALMNACKDPGMILNIMKVFLPQIGRLFAT